MFARTLKFVVAGAFAWALGCAQVVPLGDADSTLCTSMCDAVMKNCVGDNLVYETQQKCLATCALLDRGDLGAWQGTNTAACRLREAALVPAAAAEDVSTLCRSAGPEGLNCGGVCESYCTLYERACDATQCGSHTECAQKCAGLRDKGSFNAIDDFEGNTIQCRLVNLTDAAADGPTPTAHCGHAAFIPTTTCLDIEQSGTSAQPGLTCEDYCRVIGVACTADQAEAEYESSDQCLAVCEHFEVGDITDTRPNTLGCRLYQAYVSLCSPEHCPYAGPGGEGHCGTEQTDKCASYCGLANGICPSAYQAAFSGDDACLAACAALPDALPTEVLGAGYTVSQGATPGTLACRFLALGRAAVDATLCADAPFGGGACAP
jgi:hypothetical protein